MKGYKPESVIFVKPQPRDDFKECFRNLLETEMTLEFFIGTPVVTVVMSEDYKEEIAEQFELVDNDVEEGFVNVNSIDFPEGVIDLVFV